MRAEVSSGRSDFDSSWPTKLARPVSPAAAAVSIAADPPVAAVASKAVGRTVMTLILSADCTVASALPA
jgi:hypothetical protein